MEEPPSHKESWDLRGQTLTFAVCQFPSAAPSLQAQQGSVYIHNRTVKSWKAVEYIFLVSFFVWVMCTCKKTKYSAIVWTVWVILYKKSLCFHFLTDLKWAELQSLAQFESRCDDSCGFVLCCQLSQWNLTRPKSHWTFIFTLYLLIFNFDCCFFNQESWML